MQSTEYWQRLTPFKFRSGKNPCGHWAMSFSQLSMWLWPVSLMDMAAHDQYRHHKVQRLYRKKLSVRSFSHGTKPHSWWKNWVCPSSANLYLLGSEFDGSDQSEWVDGTKSVSPRRRRWPKHTKYINMLMLLLARDIDMCSVANKSII